MTDPAYEDTRLEEKLRWHAKQLAKSLEDPDREADDEYLAIAGQLRVLLVDAKVPILLSYASRRGMDLKVWGPNPPGFKGSPKTVLSFSALIASSIPVEDGHEMSISTYLETDLGAVPRPSTDPSKPPSAVWYTPKQLIKWVANKEGVAHLELKPHARLTAVRSGLEVTGSAEHSDIGPIDTSDFTVRMSVLALGKWTLAAIQSVLSS